MKAKFRKGMLIVKVPLIIPPIKSKSGKTLIVAGSNGPRRTALRIDEKPVVVIVSAYIRPDGQKEAERTKRKANSVGRAARKSKPQAHAVRRKSSRRS